MKSIVLRGGIIVNEARRLEADLLIKNGRIEKIAPSIVVDENCEEVHLNGKLILPGCIDDQVHFREPGLTHK